MRERLTLTFLGMFGGLCIALGPGALVALAALTVLGLAGMPTPLYLIYPWVIAASMVATVTYMHWRAE